MDDPDFGRAVVLLVEHGAEGALGLVLNKPTDVSVARVLPEELTGLVEEKPEEACALRHGGPCRGPLMVLHRYAPASQIEVLPGLHFATEQELVEAALREGREPAVTEGRRLLFFAGYAGWGPGQLEGEIAGGAWALVGGDAERVFGVDVGTWARLTREVSQANFRDSLNPKIVPPDASLN